MRNLPVKVVGATFFVWMTLIYGGTSVSAGCPPPNCGFYEDNCWSSGGLSWSKTYIGGACGTHEWHCHYENNDAYGGCLEY